jgi:hypothetical protein
MTALNFFGGEASQRLQESENSLSRKFLTVFLKTSHNLRLCCRKQVAEKQYDLQDAAKNKS